ncbi:MAG: hypothetical protein ACLPT4_08790 [Verrucomicrobiia bacterium]
MRLPFLAALLLIATTHRSILAQDAFLSGTSQEIGNTTFYNFTDSDGNYHFGSSQQIGGTTFHNLSDSSGNYTFGTSQQIGNTAFHNFSDNSGNDLFGTSGQIGNTTFHNFSDSRGGFGYGTSQRIGNTVFNNLTYSAGRTRFGTSFSMTPTWNSSDYRGNDGTPNQRPFAVTPTDEQRDDDEHPDSDVAGQTTYSDLNYTPSALPYQTSRQTPTAATIAEASQAKQAQTTRPPTEYPQFVLQGIIYARDGSEAMINGMSLRAGDAIEGARITSIERDAVRLNFNGSEVVLHLQ